MIIFISVSYTHLDVYKRQGSAAAPTAGLHFTDEILEKVKKKGIEVLDVTLHVGLGTFRPVKVDDVNDHHMHSCLLYTSPYYLSYIFSLDNHHL